MPKRLRAADPDVQVWQERSLLYSVRALRRGGVPAAVDPRSTIPSGSCARPTGPRSTPTSTPGWVLLDFGDAGYQGAWSLRIQQSLTDGGWTGVDVADAGNEPGWSGTPVDPRTGTEHRARRSCHVPRAGSQPRARGDAHAGVLPACPERAARHRRARPDQFGRRPHRGHGVRAAARRGMDKPASVLPPGAARARGGVRVRDRARPGRAAGRLRAGGDTCSSRRPRARTASRPAPRSRRSTTSTWAPPTPTCSPSRSARRGGGRIQSGAVAVNPSDLPTELSLGRGRHDHASAGRRGDRRREPARDELLTGRAACLPRLAGTAFVYYRPAKPGRLLHDFM